MTPDLGGGWSAEEIRRLQIENKRLRAVIETANANYARLQVIRDNQHALIICTSRLLALGDLDVAELAGIKRALDNAYRGGEQ